MSPAAALRPAVLAAVGLMLNGCGMVEADSDRFETFGEQVAALDIPMSSGDVDRGVARLPDAAAQGLRPALMRPESQLSAGPRTALTVQVMDPHDLWDARDAGLRGAIVQAAPAVAQAVVQQASERVETAVRRTTIQLGAYSSPAAAQQAWADVRQGAGARTLAGLSPTFEAVTVGGRAFTRLKVGPIPVDAAAALCHAAEVADPWCQRAA